MNFKNGQMFVLRSWIYFDFFCSLVRRVSHQRKLFPTRLRTSRPSTPTTARRPSRSTSPSCTAEPPKPSKKRSRLAESLTPERSRLAITGPATPAGGRPTQSGRWTVTLSASRQMATAAAAASRPPEPCRPKFPPCRTFSLSFNNSSSTTINSNRWVV